MCYIKKARKRQVQVEYQVQVLENELKNLVHNLQEEIKNPSLFIPKKKMRIKEIQWYLDLYCHEEFNARKVQLYFPELMVHKINLCLNYLFSTKRILKVRRGIFQSKKSLTSSDLFVEELDIKRADKS